MSPKERRPLRVCATPRISFTPLTPTYLPSNTLMSAIDHPCTSTIDSETLVTVSLLAANNSDNFLDKPRTWRANVLLKYPVGGDKLDPINIHTQHYSKPEEEVSRGAWYPNIGSTRWCNSSWHAFSAPHNFGSARLTYVSHESS